MKLPLAFLLGLAAALSLRAAPLGQTAAVQTRPEPGAPVITYLKAGSEPTVAASAGDVPPGWIAVEVPGPIEGYALGKDLTKTLDLRPGAPVYLEPKAGSGVLTTAAAGDKSEITGLLGKWTKLRIDKKLVGYVQLAPTTVGAASATLGPPMPAPAPVPPPQVVPGPGTAATAGDTAALPRVFEGTFVSSRRPLAPRRPFDWQLDGPDGARFAYLDLSKLLLTEQIETYVGRSVSVYGTLKPGPGNSLLIEVESLRLR